MAIIPDRRKIDSVRVDSLGDGFFKIPSISANVPAFLFFGEGATIKYITKYFLANSEEEIINNAKNFEVNYSPGSETLISVNGPTERVYIKGTPYYSFTREFISLPPSKNPPINRIKNTRTQVSLGGFTLNGDPIITGGSKGLIITESFLGSSAPVSGNVDGDNLITSVSKTNRRIINGTTYWDITITVQEI